MKKRLLVIIIICIIIITGLFVSKFYNEYRESITEISFDSKEQTNEETEYEPTIDEIVQQEIQQMSLREKIGQMIVVSYRTLGYNDELDQILNTVKPGGFILFSENIDTYSQITEYISKIKETADIPMLIGIDQEGGRVQRIKKLPDANVLEIPSMYTLGKTGNAELSKRVGAVLTSEIAAFGINLDYAPTLDIYSNPNNTVIGDRAFGSDYKTVIDMAIPFSKGMQENGVIPVYKHFPGHGDTDSDSHVELPVVNKTKEELYESELLPFKAAIEDGAQVIMVAHIALPKLTGDYMPSTLSREVVTGLLRDELNFDGVITTDAVNMKALSDNYSIEEICNYSINAGVDMILMPDNPIEVVDIIEKLVEEGAITEERIDESVKRILELKHNNNLYNKIDLNKDNIGTQEHIDIINQIYE